MIVRKKDLSFWQVAEDASKEAPEAVRCRACKGTGNIWICSHDAGAIKTACHCRSPENTGAGDSERGSILLCALAVAGLYGIYRFWLA